MKKHKLNPSFCLLNWGKSEFWPPNIILLYESKNDTEILSDL